MFKVMYSYFESSVSKFLPQLGWNPVISFGDEVKGRAESKIHLQLHQGAALAKARLVLHIMR
jgi:hypothetical protein